MSGFSEYTNERATYHPKFDSEEGDIILRSSEGTLYRVPSFVLRTTCGFFGSMPSLTSRSSSGSKSDTSLIPTEHPDDILSIFLLLISGLEIPIWSSFDDVCSLLQLCKSWEAPGPISIIRSSITSPFFLSDPLRLYATATHFGWEEEAKIASTHTLKLNLHDEHWEKTLSSLGVGSLLRLLRLHRSRRDKMKEMLDDITLFNAGNSGNPTTGEVPSCMSCGMTIDHHEWREFKSKVFWEMDRCAAADVIGSVEMEDWPETVACWAAKCKNEVCGRFYYDKVVTVKKLKECIARLPKTV
ncbi:hypothetical protein K435DRAFT_830530 [Dendrothele bispora CBS 962.96]|uniref:BTB domain-containing protein n=1 Tax=Dendrothele bispora (strain CBS 962.96) TaxID=1314807 RepID=A0A4S8LHN4_DENBC|nr:hypothetical protein K435DRAFT_830530 [Dendrothele bispora CBS 962.96]